MGGPGDDGIEVGEEGNSKAINHRNRHDSSVVVDERSKTENVEVVQEAHGEDVDIHADIRVAVVHEGLVAQGGDGETFLLVSGDDEGDEELEEEEARVELPCVSVG